MRPYVIAGLILMILGALALSVQSVTYFSTDREVGPLGFFAWDVSRPHTIFISPVAGLIALAVGSGLIFLDRRRASSLR